MEVMMSVNKGKGTKGRSYDELSGVGTSKAGVTGTRDTLGELRSEGALDTDYGDTGSMQSAEPEQASGSAGEGASRQGQPGGSASDELKPENQGGSNVQRGNQNR
jgi:hypothetical protein